MNWSKIDETPQMSTYDENDTQVMTKQALKSKVKLNEDKMPQGDTTPPEKDYYVMVSTEREVAANESARLYGISGGYGGVSGTGSGHASAER